MKLTVLLDQFKARGVTIEVAGDRLKLTAPTGVLTDADRVQLRRSKPELLLLLQSGAANTPATGSTPDDVPPALLEYSERMFDERLRIWRRGDFIEPTRGTLPAYRVLREHAARNYAGNGYRLENARAQNERSRHTAFECGDVATSRLAVRSHQCQPSATRALLREKLHDASQ